MRRRTASPRRRPLLLLALTAPASALIVAYGLALAGLGFLNPVWETVVRGASPLTASPG